MTTRIASLDGGRIVRRFAAAILFVASLYYLRLTIELYAFLAETINGNGLRWNALVFDLISLVIFIPVFTLIFEYGLRTMLGFDGYPWIFWGFSLLCTGLLFLPFVLVLCFNYDPSTFQRPFDQEELFYGSFPLAGAAVSFLALLTPKSKSATSQ